MYVDVGCLLVNGTAPGDLNDDDWLEAVDVGLGCPALNDTISDPGIAPEIIDWHPMKMEHIVNQRSGTLFC